MVNIYSKYFSVLYPSATWKIKTNQPDVYLTFDDGPHPEVTPYVLSILEKHQISATFFCVGKNIAQYPQLFNELIVKGHTVGNHTYNHVNGYTTLTKKYLQEFEQCQQLYPFKLFRPPYGKITPRQLTRLKTKTKIVMWSVLSCDYNINLSPADCYYTVIKNCKPGSIIVFHDSKKAFKNLQDSLEKSIITLKQKGYSFKPL